MGRPVAATEGARRPSELHTGATCSHRPAPKAVRRGRKPGRREKKPDMKVKLERSRQSARECRARKKLRYQYLEELAIQREKAVEELHNELLQYQAWANDLDKGEVPEELIKLLEEQEENQKEMVQ